MKYTVLSILTVLVFNFSIAQEKYSKVKILTDDEGLVKLQQLGVTIDHGDYKKGYSFTSDFSETEIELMKNNNFHNKYFYLILSAE